MQPSSKQPFLTSQWILSHQKLLTNLINSHTSFVLYGQRGCGKTSVIQHLLSLSPYPYLKINSILAQKKHTFLKILWTSLRKLFSYDNPTQCVSFETLCKNMQTLQQLSPQKFRSITHKGLYIFVDNMQELNVNERFLVSLFGWRDKLPFKLSFIFAGINMSNRMLLYEKPLCDMVHFTMPRPDKQFMKGVVMGHLKKDFLKQVDIIVMKCERNEEEIRGSACIVDLLGELKKREKLLEVFTAHVVEGVYLNESDLESVKRLCITFMKKVIERFEEAYEKFMQLATNKLRYDRTESDKIKLVRILNDHQFKNFFNKVCEFGSQNAWLLSKRNIQDETIQDQYFQKKIFYPELIKASIYFAEVCPEADDTRRFKEFKGKNSKRNFEFKTQKTKVKKHNVLRVMAISESLESQTRMPTREKKIDTHSMDYYTCFQHLVEEGDLKFVGRSGAYGLGKIQSRTNEHEAAKLMKNMDLKMEQFKPR